MKNKSLYILLISLGSFYLGTIYSSRIAPNSRAESHGVENKMANSLDENTKEAPVIRVARSSQVNSKESMVSSQQKTESKRYQLIMDKLAERKESLSWIGFGDNLESNENLGKFFDLTDAEKQRLAQVCEKHRSLVKTWEAENRKILKATGSDLVYEIPADENLANTLKSDFVHDLHEILGSDGVNFLSGSVDSFYNDFSNKRIVSYSINDLNSKVAEYKYSVEKYDENGEQRSRSGSNSFVTLNDSVANPKKVPNRYDHLIKIE